MFLVRYKHHLLYSKDIPLTGRRGQEICFLRDMNIICILEMQTIPVTGRGGIQGCEMLRIRHCLDNRLTAGSNSVRLTHLPRFSYLEIVFSFLPLILNSVRG
jgi:hypothetical protein